MADPRDTAKQTARTCSDRCAASWDGEEVSHESPTICEPCAAEALALAREEGRRAGIEEAARYVRAQAGTFQNAGGPVRQIDAALRCVADDIRALASPPPPGAGDTTGNEGKRE